MCRVPPGRRGQGRAVGTGCRPVAGMTGGWGLMAAQPVEVIAILYRYQPPSRPSPFLGEGEKHAQPDSSAADARTHSATHVVSFPCLTREPRGHRPDLQRVALGSRVTPENDTWEAEQGKKHAHRKIILDIGENVFYKRSISSHPGAWLASRPVMGRECGSPFASLRMMRTGVRVRPSSGVWILRSGRVAWL